MATTRDQVTCRGGYKPMRGRSKRWYKRQLSRWLRRWAKRAPEGAPSRRRGVFTGWD